MPIPFRCSSCGQEYPVSDHHAGRLVKCAFCQEMTRAGPPAGSTPPTTAHRASSLSSRRAPDRSPLSHLAPPKPPSSLPPPSPPYGMDYIAPPPKIVSKKKATATATSTPRVTP